MGQGKSLTVTILVTQNISKLQLAIAIRVNKLQCKVSNDKPFLLLFCACLWRSRLWSIGLLVQFVPSIPYRAVAGPPRHQRSRCARPCRCAVSGRLAEAQSTGAELVIVVKALRV